MEKDTAIKVENLSKTFRIPHEKITTIRGEFVNAFRTKSYEEFKALDDVSFEVKKGEFFGIIGRNGSGKSTLLKVLAGVYKPDGGKIQINGLISPFLELGIGFQPELSGRDNIYLNSTVLGLTQKQIDERFDDIVEFSELRRFIDQKIKNYSSGMQVRLAFSVAIHANREILLMDEVLAVGDTNFQSKCIKEFVRYKDQEKTVLLVSHDIATIERYCDRALLLQDGKIVKIGTAEEVIKKYTLGNLDDEEKRMISQKEKIKHVLGCKKNAVYINKMETQNEHGENRYAFREGEGISILLKIIFNREENNPEVGIIIGNSNCKHLLVTNTMFRNVKLGTVKPGETIIKFQIDNVFASGEYNVTGVVSDKGGKLIYDLKNNLCSFVVVNKNTTGGLIDPKHSIEIVS